MGPLALLAGAVYVTGYLFGSGFSAASQPSEPPKPIPVVQSHRPNGPFISQTDAIRKSREFQKAKENIAKCGHASNCIITTWDFFWDDLTSK